MKPAPGNLKKINDVVEKGFVNKTVYDKKFNAIENTDISNLVKKLTIMQKLVKLKKKRLNYDHDKYITTQ